ncbi:hypothetical protein [Sphingobium lactosutens]|uniref:hypothetical protein n=1 Tax=Sphingobium lactosutens TaxID=522773 RepID=UPI001D18CFD2|nr:hypothetical protein [Sphingobium lactosutens]MCC4256991.1 hypothetical protein [Sphingobium lactosutens]
MGNIPLIQYRGKRAYKQQGIFDGHLFACRIDPTLYGDHAYLEAEANKLIAKTTSPALAVAWVNCLEAEQSCQQEQWAVWLNDQRDNHNGGDWFIDHMLGHYAQDFLSWGHIEIVVESDATAMLFKTTFQGM